MTDIVERLREYARNCGGPPEDYLTWQAADEVERLRATLEKIEEETERTCQQCCMIENIARAALERKP